MTQSLAPQTDTTTVDLHHITQLGRLASCMVRLNMQDLNTQGAHREEAKEWFSHADSGAASLAFCSQSLANLNRYLLANAPSDRSAMPHLDDIMPDDVQSPAEWKEKLASIAAPESLSPDDISRRHKAGQNIEALTDALVDECREVHQQLTHEVSIQGATLPAPSDENDGYQQGLDSPHDGQIMRL